MFAERYGSPLDAALVVRNEQGTELARVEDSPGTLDPILEYTVPATVTAVVVGVVDSQGRGGPGAVYRLVVEPARTGSVKKDFQLFHDGTEDRAARHWSNSLADPDRQEQ